MIYSIYGFGKCKTETAIGMGVRALSNNEDVLFCQFLKDGKSSEVKFLVPYFNLEYRSTRTSGLVYTEEDINSCKALLASLFKSKASLIIADELLVAYDLGYVSFNKIKELVDYCNHNSIDLCMTGRMNSKDKRHKIDSISDIVTNAYAKKHWFNTYCNRCKCEYEYHYKYCPKCGGELLDSKPSKKGRDY